MPSIECRARNVHGFESAKYFRIRLGMAHRQPSTFGQAAVKLSEDFPNDLPVEIDHDVAAENQIEGGDPVRQRRIGMFDEIVILKRHPFSNAGRKSPGSS